MATGYDLTAAEAAPILAEHRITRNTIIPDEGIQVDYKGQVAWILQGSYYMPFSNTRPDGVHFVYVAGADEQPPAPDGSIWDTVIKLAGWAIAAYSVVGVLNAFKKGK